MARAKLNYDQNEKKEAKALAKKLGLPCWAWTRKVRASHWGAGYTMKGFYVGWNVPNDLCKANVVVKKV